MRVYRESPEVTRAVEAYCREKVAKLRGRTVEKSDQNFGDKANCPDGHPWSPWETHKIPDKVALEESRHCTNPDCRYTERREVKWLPKGADRRHPNGH